MHQKLIASVAAIDVLTGCASIGEINGVPVGQNRTLSSQSEAEEAPFCEREPAVCILGVAVLIGLVGVAASSGGSTRVIEPERARTVRPRGSVTVGAGAVASITGSSRGGGVGGAGVVGGSSGGLR